MQQTLKIGLVLAAAAMTVFGQDWYHERDARFRGEGWRTHVFSEVRSDLEHVWSGHAADRERTRLQKTEEELSKMQADLDHGRWDNGILNDVIDSIDKSANDDRLARRDRDVLADDVRRLKEFQDQHNNHR
ncbi:MAG TPA: hypothetical protein VG897_15285 [Terriglobales bacterium]|nr:hypothetical protein [Terriglobales bacterium]